MRLLIALFVSLLVSTANAAPISINVNNSAGAPTGGCLEWNLSGPPNGPFLWQCYPTGTLGPNQYTLTINDNNLCTTQWMLSGPVTGPNDISCQGSVSLTSVGVTLVVDDYGTSPSGCNTWQLYGQGPFVVACTLRGYTHSIMQRAYIAYYGRPADPSGQEYWSAVLESNNESLQPIINAFATSIEFTTRYGGLDNATLITRIYQQLLGRDPEPAGLTYWLSELASGRRTTQSITLDILNGANGNADAASVNNKVAAADYYTNKARRGCSFGTATDAAAYLATVTSDVNTVPSAKDLLDTRCP